MIELAKASKPQRQSDSPPIDFVILWVDGNDPLHRQKRLQYLTSGPDVIATDSEQSIDERRFIQSNELRYCLRSIKTHAPWYRKIWLVTDQQTPDFLDNSMLAEDRLEIIDHRQIFRTHPECLPTFNTRSIVSMLDCIPGLAEHFIYGNDDFMLGAAVDTSFFFQHGLPVIYGDWTTLAPGQPMTLFQQGMVNAAELVDFNQSNFITISHGFQPMKRSLIQTLKRRFPLAFQNNLKHRFRHRSQFLLESLLNHYCHQELDVPVQSTELMVHFSFELCRIGTAEKIQFLLELFLVGERKMFCINEYQSLYPRVEQVKCYLEQICGSPLRSERTTAIRL